jgi:choline dehydrogenase-like flavoprotein
MIVGARRRFVVSMSCLILTTKTDRCGIAGKAPPRQPLSPIERIVAARAGLDADRLRNSACGPRGDNLLRGDRFAKALAIVGHWACRLTSVGVDVVHDLPRITSIYTRSQSAQVTTPTIAWRARTGLGRNRWLLVRVQAGTVARHPAPLGLGHRGGPCCDEEPRRDAETCLPASQSRGTVRIASADPKTGPLIDPNYWADPYDRECSIKGLRLAREILRPPALKPFVVAERIPGDNPNTDEQLAEYAYRSRKTDHHPAGTCAKGSGPDAVVMPDLKVRGLLGIRVVDASVMPFVPSSNTNAPTIMVAEKASDLIPGKTPLATTPL